MYLIIRDVTLSELSVVESSVVQNTLFNFELSESLILT